MKEWEKIKVKPLYLTLDALFKTKKIDFKKLSEDFEKKLKQNSLNEHNKAKNKKIKETQDRNFEMQGKIQSNLELDENNNSIIKLNNLDNTNNTNNQMPVEKKGSFMRHYSNYECQIMKKHNVRYNFYCRKIYQFMKC